MKKSNLFSVLILFLLGSPVLAQNIKKLEKKSQKFFYNENFKEALDLYKEILYINPNHQVAKYRSTISSIMIDDEDTDVDKLLAFGSSQGSDDRFYNYWLGRAYYLNEDFDKAQEAWDEFLSEKRYRSPLIIEETTFYVEEAKVAEEKQAAERKAMAEKPAEDPAPPVDVVTPKPEAMEPETPAPTPTPEPPVEEVAAEAEEYAEIEDISNKFRTSTKIALKNIHFDFNQSDISDAEKIKLEPLVAAMKENPDLRIEIAGHADNIGTDEVNQAISLARANSAVAYLVQKGIARNRVTPKGYGETKPAASNDYEKNGRELNRRIEIIIIE